MHLQILQFAEEVAKEKARVRGRQMCASGFDKTHWCSELQVVQDPFHQVGTLLAHGACWGGVRFRVPLMNGACFLLDERCEPCFFPVAFDHASISFALRL